MLHVKSITLTHILCFRCSFQRFCCFKVALPSLLFLSKDEVKASHSDFDRCPCGGGLRTDNPPDRHFSQPYFISEFASFWICFEQANWTGSRKKLGYEVNFLSTASGTVEQYTQVSSAAVSSLLVQSIARKKRTRKFR